MLLLIGCATVSEADRQQALQRAVDAELAWERKEALFVPHWSSQFAAAGEMGTGSVAGR